ncbi:MAG: hypothetical protein AAGG51_26705 [Cyanobacteria bacterium P01_G01_bin.54]
MSALRWLIFGLFFPACLILLGQVIWSPAIAARILALALLLLCIDQSRAAVLDLENTFTVQEHNLQEPIADPRLDRFYRVTLCAIALELMGFYGAWISLGWGAILVFFSQVGFHCTAGIRLNLSGGMDGGLEIVPWGIAQRWLLLLANGIGVVLLDLWMQAIAPLWMASAILGLVCTYGVIKYAPTLHAR